MSMPSDIILQKSIESLTSAVLT